jgi:hypothetical protein
LTSADSKLEHPANTLAHCRKDWSFISARAPFETMVLDSFDSKHIGYT